jgi:hypothetical protein
MSDTWEAGDLKLRSHPEGGGTFGYVVVSADNDEFRVARGHGSSSEAAARKAGRAAIDRLIGTGRA